MDIPSDWQIRSVSELQANGCLLVEDGNHGENRPRREEFVDEGTAFIRAADMDQGRILFSSASRINEIALGRVRKGIGVPGDTLLSHKGTVGKVAFAPFECEPFVCSPQTTFWRSLDDSVIDPRYLFYFLQSPFFQQQLHSRMNESDMAGYVSLTVQRTLRVLLPSIFEQLAVSEALGSLNDKIDLNARMNGTLEEISREIFKSWFVDSYSTDRDDLDSSVPLEELAILSKEKIDPVGRPDETFVHYSIPAFDRNKTPVLQKGSEIKSVKFVVPSDAVLLSRLNPRIQRVWLPDVESGKVCLSSTEFAVIRPKSGVTREFLLCLFTSDVFQTRFKSLVTGTSGSHQRVQPGDLLRIAVPRVGEEKVAAFTEHVLPMLRLAAQNVRESGSLRGLRDLLVPKLTSGEIRVGSPEWELEGAT